MDEVFINVREINGLNTYFKKDIVSVEEIVCALQEEIWAREEREEKDRKEEAEAEERWLWEHKWQ